MCVYIHIYVYYILLQAHNQYEQKCRDADRAEEAYNKLQSVPTTKPQDLLKVWIRTATCTDVVRYRYMYVCVHELTLFFAAQCISHSVCVRVCVCVCVRACMRVCVRACVRAYVRACVCGFTGG